MLYVGFFLVQVIIKCFCSLLLLFFISKFSNCITLFANLLQNNITVGLGGTMRIIIEPFVVLRITNFFRGVCSVLF